MPVIAHHTCLLMANIEITLISIMLCHSLLEHSVNEMEECYTIYCIKLITRYLHKKGNSCYAMYCNALIFKNSVFSFILADMLSCYALKQL